MAQRTNEGFIWIPREYTTQYQILVDGDDVTELLRTAKFSRVVTQGSGKGYFELYDVNYSGQEEVEVYIDFSDASTLVYRGTVESAKPLRDGTTTAQRLKTRHVSHELLDFTVTASYEDTEVSVIMKELIDEYTDNYTYTNIEDTGKTVTASWSNKPFWQVMIDLATFANYHVYVDDGRDFHLFAQGTNDNPDEAIVYNDTMANLKGLGEDSADVKNKVIVYGESDGIPIVATSEDADSQDEYGLKEEVIKDNDISSYKHAKDLADAVIEQSHNPPDSGLANCYMMPFLNPGDLIWVTDPSNNIHGKYEVHKYTHQLPSSTTKVELKEPKAIPRVLREHRRADLAQEDIVNPQELDQSYVLPFDNNNFTLSHSSTEVANGELVVQDGSTTGEFVSAARQEEEEVTEAQLKVSGDNISSARFYVSGNNGVNWQEMNPDEYSMLNAAGKRLKIRVELTNSDQVVNTVSVLYS